MCLTYETDNSVEWERTSGGIIHLVRKCMRHKAPTTNAIEVKFVRQASSVASSRCTPERWTQLGVRGPQLFLQNSGVSSSIDTHVN